MMQNKIQKAFGQICADNALKDTTKKAVLEKAYGKQVRKPFTTKRIYSYGLLASFALCCIIFMGKYLYFTPTAVISIDVNPSIELDVNRFDQIIGVEGYNEDGQELAASLDVLYKDYESALSEVLEAQWMQDYLQEDEMLSIAVVQTEEKQGAEILDYVKNCTEKQKNTYCYCLDSEDVSEAHALGLSYGRYRWYKEISLYDSQITPEELNQMSMREIRDLFLSIAKKNGETAIDLHRGNGKQYGKELGKGMYGKQK